MEVVILNIDFDAMQQTDTFAVQEQLRCGQPCLLTFDFDILRICALLGTSLVSSQLLLRRFPTEDCVVGESLYTTQRTLE